MERPARLALLTLVALALLGASSIHLLWQPAAAVKPGHTNVVFVQAPVEILDPAEVVVVDRVRASGLRIISMTHVSEAISDRSLVVTTDRGLLVVTDAQLACADAAHVARDLHVIGNGDPAELDRLSVGRVAGVMVFTIDADVWSALGPTAC